MTKYIGLPGQKEKPEPELSNNPSFIELLIHHGNKPRNDELSSLMRRFREIQKESPDTPSAERRAIVEKIRKIAPFVF